MKKLLLTFIMLMMSGLALSDDIYIEQSGNSSTIDINQDGTGNTIGDALNPMFFGGGSNMITIDQIGNNNSLTGYINGASADSIVNTTGTGNIQEITCGSLLSAGCGASTINQTIMGDTNTVTQNLGTGANHNSQITVTGSSNGVTHTSTNAGASTVSVDITGSTNTVGVTQSGLTAKSVSVTATGNLNNISITQQE